MPAETGRFARTFSKTVQELGIGEIPARSEPILLAPQWNDAKRVEFELWVRNKGVSPWNLIEVSAGCSCVKLRRIRNSHDAIVPGAVASYVVSIERPPNPQIRRATLTFIIDSKTVYVPMQFSWESPVEVDSVALLKPGQYAVTAKVIDDWQLVGIQANTPNVKITKYDVVAGKLTIELASENVSSFWAELSVDLLNRLTEARIQPSIQVRLTSLSPIVVPSRPVFRVDSAGIMRGDVRILFPRHRPSSPPELSTVVFIMHDGVRVSAEVNVRPVGGKIYRVQCSASIDAPRSFGRVLQAEFSFNNNEAVTVPVLMSYEEDI